MLIKALERTFAPFVQPEKPQVFPTPATSFIKDYPDIGILEPIGRRRCRERRRFRTRGGRYGYACFDWGFCDDLTQSDRAKRRFESVSAPGLGIFK
jgi:hypothetical protein